MARVKIPDGLETALAGRATPFYWFDRGALERSIARWVSAGRLGATVFYPYKCNRHSALLDHLARSFGAEINIAADLPAAVARGLSGPRLVVQGPAKERGFIDAALAAEATLVADATGDADAIFARGRALGRRPRYLLRLHERDARRGQHAFGMSGAEALRIARNALRRGDPAPNGLAFHLGTGLPNFAPFRRSIRAAASVARALAAAGAPVSVLDAGGGFPCAAESRFDDRGRPHRTAWTDPRAIVRDILTETRRAIGDVELWVEPGRALVADAFSLVARVVRARPRGEVYVDASRMAHAFFAARGRHPIAAIPARRGRPSRLTIAGLLGTDLDVFARDVPLVPPRDGDAIVFGAVGAYNLIAANEWAGPVPPVVEAE